MYTICTHNYPTTVGGAILENRSPCQGVACPEHWILVPVSTYTPPPGHNSAPIGICRSKRVQPRFKWGYEPTQHLDINLVGPSDKKGHAIPTRTFADPFRAILMVNILERIARKLRRIILLHLGRVTFRIYF